MSQNFNSPSRVLRRFRFLPQIMRHVRTWPQFMRHYGWGRVPGSPYVMRNGAKIQIGRGVDHVPIIEIFLRQDYGEMPDGATIVDIGANIGVFTLYAAMNGRGNRVFAYEPMSEFHALLSRNVADNGLGDRVACFPLAVASQAEERVIFTERPGFFFPTLLGQDGQGAGEVTIRCTTLAAIVADNGLDTIDLLKMDCEGAEYEIFYQASDDTLARIREIRLEYHVLKGADENPDSLAAYLQDRGFRVTHRHAFDPTNGVMWLSR
jgi:FkbM family methyltransferase